MKLQKFIKPQCITLSVSEPWAQATVFCEFAVGGFAVVASPAVRSVGLVVVVHGVLLLCGGDLPGSGIELVSCATGDS